MGYVKKERPKVYLSNKDLNYQMIVSKEQGKLTKEAQAMIILLTKNVIKKFYYVNPDDKLDCLQSAYLDIFANWSSFNPEKGDAFSWITEVVKRGMAKGWNKVHKTKGADVDIISLSAYDSDGNSYDRF